jgi:hypothetical protein
LGTKALLKEPVYTNFDLSVSAQNSDDDGMGVVFRDDGKNFYRLLLVKDPANGGPFVMLDKYANGAFSAIASNTTQSIIQNEVYALRVRADGSHLQCWIDTTLVFDITNDSLVQGNVGLYSYGSKGLAFDDLLIESL